MLFLKNNWFKHNIKLIEFCFTESKLVIHFKLKKYKSLIKLLQNIIFV